MAAVRVPAPRAAIFSKAMLRAVEVSSPLGWGEVGENLVVQVDEGLQELLARVELDGEPPFGEVDVEVVRARLQAPANVSACLPHEVRDEGLLRVGLEAVLGTQEAECGRRDRCLLHRNVGVSQGGAQVLIGVLAVGARARDQSGQLAGVPFSVDNRPAACSSVASMSCGDRGRLPMGSVAMLMGSPFCTASSTTAPLC